MTTIIRYEGTVTSTKTSVSDPADDTGLETQVWIESDPVKVAEDGATTRISQAFVVAPTDRPAVGARVRVTLELL